MAEVFKIWNTYISPATNALLDLGSNVLKWNNLYLDGVAYFDAITMAGNIDCNDYSIESIGYLYGVSNDDYLRMGITGRLIINMTAAGIPFATPDIDITGSVFFDDDVGLATTKQIQFRDTELYISSKDDGHLDLDADTSVDLNGNIILGSASTSTLTCTGRLIVRTTASDPQDATPASRPAGSVAEIAYYTGKLYFCTNAATPTWELITSS